MQSFNDFCDVLWDIALKNEIVTKRDASDDKVFNILTDIYNTEFYKYEERGLYITPHPFSFVHLHKRAYDCSS